MKKLLLFMLLSLPFGVIKAMEEDKNAYEKDYERGEESEKQVISSGIVNLIGQGIPEELQEKIFNYANYQSAQDVIQEIKAIIEINTIEFKFKDSMRYVKDPFFAQISRIIKKAPISGYTRIALFITMSRVFSKYEKLHFLSIMLMHEHITKKQRSILDFLSNQARRFKRDNYKLYGCRFLATSFASLTEDSLRCTDFNDIETIIKFLFKNGASLPGSTIELLIEKKEKQIINLVYWALKNGATLNEPMLQHGITPLEYCKEMLNCWLDEKWLSCPEESRYSEEQYAHKIGKIYVCGYSESNTPSHETIEHNVNYFKQLIEIFECYMPENPEPDISEIEPIENL